MIVVLITMTKTKTAFKPFKPVNSYNRSEGGAPGVTVRPQWASGDDKMLQMLDQYQSETRHRWPNYINYGRYIKRSTLSNATYLQNNSVEDDSFRYPVIDINIDSNQSQDNTSSLAISTPLYVNTLAKVPPVTVNTVTPITLQTTSTITNVTPSMVTSMDTVESLEPISIVTEVSLAARSSTTED
jgi:hypothetical protein